ncbi:MAG: host attachment protein [Aquamicrobium sp.]|nr:host attachment protein [Aquamicrobium sp.]
MKAKTSWVLVADGARARIVRDLGMDAGAEDRLDDLVYEIDHKQLREIMADKPGRGFASEGARRSAMEYRSDPVQEQEVEFAGMLLDELERRHAADEFGRLAIVAEPRMLGTLRQKLPAALRQAVVKEVPKDLTKLPVKELREALAALDLVPPRPG